MTISRRASNITRTTFALLAVIACSETTQPSRVASVSLGTPAPLLSLREPRLLSATFLDASNRFLTDVSPTWTSSNDAIVTVDQQGNVFGVSLGGPVTITVTAEGKSASTQLTVVPARIAISPGTATLELGTTRQLTGTPLDFEGAPIAVGAVAWSSSNPGAATVGASSGLVTTVAAGNTVITATAAGRTSGLNLETGVPTALDGRWVGTSNTTQGTLSTREIRFDVVFGAVRNFQLVFLTGGDNICGVSLTASSTGQSPVVNNEFQITLDPPARAGATPGIVSGAFTSNSAMAGTYTQINFGSFSCPSPGGGIAFPPSGLLAGSVAATKQ